MSGCIPRNNGHQDLRSTSGKQEGLREKARREGSGGMVHTPREDKGVQADAHGAALEAVAVPPDGLRALAAVSERQHQVQPRGPHPLPAINSFNQSIQFNPPFNPSLNPSFNPSLSFNSLCIPVVEEGEEEVVVVNPLDVDVEARGPSVDAVVHKLRCNHPPVS